MFCNQLLLHRHQPVRHHGTTRSGCFNTELTLIVVEALCFLNHPFEAARLKASLIHLSCCNEKANQITANWYFIKHFLFITGWSEGSVRKRANMRWAAIADKVWNGVVGRTSKCWDGCVFYPAGKGNSDYVCAWMLFRNSARKDRNGKRENRALSPLNLSTCLGVKSSNVYSKQASQQAYGNIVYSIYVLWLHNVSF